MIMKSKLFVLVLSLFVFAAAANAQGGGQGGPPRRTIEERIKAIDEKFADFKLDKDKSAQVDSIFTNYYKATDKLREEAMAGGGQPDFQAMREKMTPLITERDDKLKKVLTEDQFKKWKDEIEPSMRPQRRQGGGGNN
jgi:periplasmic protein CpxP/Spy